MRTPISVCIAALALSLAAGTVGAAPVLSTSAGTQASAQSLNGLFTTNSLANVLNSTTLGHVEISQRGRPSAGLDWYSFSHQGGTVHLDIDDRINGAFFDTELGIWNSAGLLIAANDDNGSDAGDSSGLNAAIFNLNLSADTYFIGVCQFNCGFGNGFGITGSVISTNGGYVLNVSGNNVVATVPEPGSMALAGLALLGAAGARARRKR